MQGSWKEFCRNVWGLVSPLLHPSKSAVQRHKQLRLTLPLRAQLPTGPLQNLMPWNGYSLRKGRPVGFVFRVTTYADACV
jgi:hypothetical protein